MHHQEKAACGQHAAFCMEAERQVEKRLPAARRI